MAEKLPLRKHKFNEGKKLSPWRESLNRVIFGVETTAGRTFDVFLIIMIVLSILMVMLDSVDAISKKYVTLFSGVEWFFTLLFSIEYLLRLLCVRRPWLYARSFFGIIDILSILPTYIGLLFPGVEYLLTLRVLRLLRIFRVLKLSEYMDEAQILMVALVNSFRKITVFMYVVLTLVVVFGSIMYVIEGSESGFTSIPVSVYWAIVTITTVGYGDIAPKSALGQIIASFMMIMGYGIIAVPTGIYSAELLKSKREADKVTDACQGCGASNHDFDADYCKYCGFRLDDR
jgi:voltage-gated potassium channel